MYFFLYDQKGKIIRLEELYRNIKKSQSETVTFQRANIKIALQRIKMDSCCKKNI